MAPLVAIAAMGGHFSPAHGDEARAVATARADAARPHRTPILECCLAWQSRARRTLAERLAVADLGLVARRAAELRIERLAHRGRWAVLDIGLAHEAGRAVGIGAAAHIDGDARGVIAIRAARADDRQCKDRTETGANNAQPRGLARLDPGHVGSRVHHGGV